MATSAVQKLKASDLPLNTVTVYTDRAELLRIFKVQLQPGTNSVVVEHVSPHIDTDSIRVDGKGSGVTLQEVKSKYDYATSKEVDSPKVKELQETVKKLEGELNEAQTLEQIYQKQLDGLNSLLAEKLEQVSLISPEFDKLAERLSSLRSVHRTQSLEVARLLPELKAKIANLKMEIEKVEKQIASIRTDSKRAIRTIHLDLDAEKQCEATIELTYQVGASSWTPSYDLRVESPKNGAGKQSGTGTKGRLFYYGNVQQRSGEDWNGVKLVLSTAQPRIGGTLPELGMLEASFYRPPVAKQRRPTTECYAMAMRRTGAPPTGGIAENVAESSDEDMGIGMMDFVAERQLLSTSFSIPEEKSIPSDSTEHRVTIAVIELAPMLVHHHCVPCKNTNVYLMASSLNTSDYPLLRGGVSIYLDGAFNSKSFIKGVECGERVELALGVDTTVKLDYKPHHENKGQAGFLSQNSATLHEQRMTVKNTNASKSVRLTIYEHLPKSTDERIKVELCSPEKATKEEANGTVVGLAALKPPEVGVVVNEQNNVKWTLELGPGEKRDLLVAWKLTFPNSERVEYKERL